MVVEVAPDPRCFGPSEVQAITDWIGDRGVPAECDCWRDHDDGSPYVVLVGRILREFDVCDEDGEIGRSVLFQCADCGRQTTYAEWPELAASEGGFRVIEGEGRARTGAAVPPALMLIPGGS